MDFPLTPAEPTETVDAARILDAAANRAREALRVVEDYCRFVLDDSSSSRELKHCATTWSNRLEACRPRFCWKARETLRDVGTGLTTARERERHSLLEVARANLKRLQEALRSLEEVGKLYRSDLGEHLEQLRYRSYTLERAILLGSDSRCRLAEWRSLRLADRCEVPRRAGLDHTRSSGRWCRYVPAPREGPD